MKKFLCAALIVLTLGFIPCGAASADEALADSMTPGTWTTNPRYITFGEYNGHALKWRVLEVYDDKTAFLVLDDVLRDEGGTVKQMYFDDDFNNFPATPIGIQPSTNPESEISAWLNKTTDDGFLASLSAYNTGILTATYKADNGNNAWYGGRITDTAASKIFLLSVGEIRNPKYFIGGDDYAPNADRDVGSDYWLRSPGNRDNFAASVWPDGLLISYGDYVNYTQLALRPALKIDISSSVFTSDLVSYPTKKAREPE